jgi:lysophospholipase L1-like esterase
VVGQQGLSGMGGFRRTVIDTLRGRSGYPLEIGCAGVIVSGLLSPSQDDSSMAQSGETAFDIYDSLSTHSSVNADLWIFMNGVNDGYSSFPGLYYCENTLDMMHLRNPKSEIYVINGLPLPRDTADALYTIDSTMRKNLLVFNRKLDSAVTARRTQWRARNENCVWLVNAFTALSSSAGDTTYNTAYFSDFIHPNQAGYEVLAKLILSTMNSAGSAFLQ